jgi:hypothetical protein
MQFDDDEAIKAFVADKSEHRNITKGQKAMRLALLHPEPEKGGRGKTVLKRDGFSKQRLSDARAVLAFSRELALSPVIASISRVEYPSAANSLTAVLRS